MFFRTTLPLSVLALLVAVGEGAPVEVVVTDIDTVVDTTYVTGPAVTVYATAPDVVVDVTSTAQAVTVTAGAASIPAAAAAPTTSSTAAAAATSSASSSSVSAEGYGEQGGANQGWDMGASAAVSTSSSVAAAAPATTSSSSVYVAPAPVTTSSVESTSTAAAATTSSSAVASSTSSASQSTTSATSGSKRGLAYNTASLTSAFSKASWAYNWGNLAGTGLSSSLEYVPMLWGMGSHLDGWAANVKTSLAAGSKHILAFNEPDMTTQASLSPSAAAQGYKDNIQTYASQASLGAPAITNSETAGEGLDWLTQFMDACTDCTINFVPIHWYDNAPGDVDYFKNHTQKVYDAVKKPIWITEFGLNVGATADQQAEFLKEVLPWLEETSYVERYAYFGVFDGDLLSGTSLNTAGDVYNSD